MAIARINFKTAKGRFFDADAVLKRLDKTEQRVLSRFGAFVRTTARRSIRRRKKPSEPGNPPSAHGDLLKKILFSYDRNSQSVVVGPIKLNGRSTNDVLETLEHGGTVRRRFAIVKNPKKRGSRRRNQTRIVSTRKAPSRVVTYEPRPFMGPALEKELPKLPGMWANQIY